MGKLYPLASRGNFAFSFTGCALFLGSIVSFGKLEEQRGNTLVEIYSFFDSQEILASFKSCVLLSPIILWAISR